MSKDKSEQEQKFILLYQAYVDEIYQYIYLRIGMQQSLAEDLTQDIFLSVYKGMNGFKGLSSERTWIYTIAKNKLTDYYRKEYSKKYEMVELDEQLTESLADVSQNIQTIMVKSLERDQIRECLNGLTKQYRIVLILKYLDDKSVREIADMVGKSKKAMESTLQRAKGAFIRNYRQYLEKEDV